MTPNARITSLLAEVHRWTRFASVFTHQQTDLPADDLRVVLTGVLAEATNLGLSRRLADACSVDFSRRKLAWTAGWHLREETYRSAPPLCWSTHNKRQPLAALFGAADVSSSDGQGFPTAGRGEAMSAINAHYGRSEVSALFYTHVSARHAHAPTVAISPSGEAAHVIDGLLHHEQQTSASPSIHTDGGGVSDHVFASATSAGIPVSRHHASPISPSVGSMASDRASNWPALAPFIAGRPDEHLIAAHWDDVLRLAASVRTGTVSASLMLKRLGAYPRQNGLAIALSEIGRIERTLYTLDWLEKAPLRRQATAELNKGESRNALARAVCFHRLGRLRDRTAELQQHRASGLTLVTAAIVLCGTPSISAAPWTHCDVAARSYQMRCSTTSPRLDDSTSISPATTFGMPTPKSAQTASEPCAAPIRSPRRLHDFTLRSA